MALEIFSTVPFYNPLVAGRFTDSNSSIGGGDAPIVWINKSFDTVGGMSMSNGVWVVGSGLGGKYHLHSQLVYSFNAAAVNNVVQNSIYVNGVATSQTINRLATSMTAQFCPVGDILQLADGDNVVIKGSCNAGSPSLQSGNASQIYFSIFRLGN